MVRRHFVELVSATGLVVADWETVAERTEDLYPPPTPPAGRVMVEVTDRQVPLATFNSHTYAGGVFTPPVVSRTVTVDALFELFTRAERVAIRQKARGDQAASPPVAPDDVLADLVHQIDLKIGQSVNLDSPKLAAALTLLVDKGLLTTARRTQILAGTAPV